MYNTKNYTEPGGEVTHIGGKLIIEEGAEVIGVPSTSKTADNVAASTATNVAGVRDDLNAVITALKAAGLMAADTQ